MRVQPKRLKTADPPPISMAAVSQHPPRHYGEHSGIIGMSPPGALIWIKPLRHGRDAPGFGGPLRSAGAHSTRRRRARRSVRSERCHDPLPNVAVMGIGRPHVPRRRRGGAAAPERVLRILVSGRSAPGRRRRLRPLPMLRQRHPPSPLTQVIGTSQPVFQYAHMRNRQAGGACGSVGRRSL